MRDKIYRIVADVLDVPIEEITDESSAYNIPDWDSLEHLDLILALEDEFNIVLEFSNLLESMTVGNIIKIVGTLT